MLNTGVSSKISFKKLASKVRNVYVGLSGEDIPADANSLIKRRLEVLKTIKEEAKNFRELDCGEIDVFLKAHLDAVGIVAAVNGDIVDLSAENFGIFGHTGIRRGRVFVGTCSQADDWFFSDLSSRVGPR
ncbi:hypothetical protein AKJ44_02270 [candidate division MSBL1 archaeon SCGC-AAA261F17]|uniref:Uncharacterized protein n=1 Tax=candidate division MSBL1 archaeon SCGC-AAA261F17 TaxID=1698274 RepID=A0A133V5F4_9EURY|nr:hypothetical protein AKJ44_02270 [candidate division MSBL1 archaeon SCGC-AAA261F17]